ncbi:hypothetical protein ACFWIB_14475 [Streptomyces sp. NPDC127051]|uniref:hypothetical protein n=1 Tax=Streptomyces sp. NPDC127051 TaxID=3347119 RepID=UPI0036635EC1
MIREAPHHNTLTCYTDYNCRLPECVERFNSWYRARAHAKAAGTWQPLVDAEPVRQHLLKLYAADVTVNEVAEALDMHRRNVRAFTHRGYDNKTPRRYRVSPEVAARILALTVADFPPKFINPIGSLRRVQALAALGWPSRHVFQRSGLSPANRCAMLSRPTIRRDSADAISRSYETLRRLKPERHGVVKHIADRTRRHAAAERFVPPKYWDRFPDCIDDPHFTPEYGLTKPELRAEEAAWLVTTAGLARTEAAARLGMTFGEVDDAVELHRTDMRKAA